MNASRLCDRDTDMVPIPDKPFVFQGGSQAGNTANAKDRMAQEFVAQVQARGVRVMRRSLGRVSFALREFCRLLWTIDGHTDLVSARSAFTPDATPFLGFAGANVEVCIYKRWKEHGHRRPRLSSEELANRCQSASAALLNLTAYSYMNKTGAPTTRQFFAAMESFIAYVTRLADHMDDNRLRVQSQRASKDNSYITPPSQLNTGVFSQHAASQETGDVRPAQSHSECFSGNMESGVCSVESGISALRHSTRPLQRAYLSPLERSLSVTAVYKPLLLDFEAHAQEGSPLRASKAVARNISSQVALRQSRHRAREDIKSGVLAIPIGYYSCVVPGPVGTIFVIWRLPELASSRSDDRQAAAIFTAARFVPSIMSRAQTKQYTSTMVTLAKNGDLKGSAAQALLETFAFRTSSRTVQDDLSTARALSAILGTDTCLAESQDEESRALTTDLRRDRMPAQCERFSAFFAAAEKYLDSDINETGAAVDQRRAVGAGGVGRIYMPVAMSLTDLRNRVSIYATERLGMNEGHDFSLPSLEWLRLQFVPQRPGVLSAAKFTGRLSRAITYHSREP